MAMASRICFPLVQSRLVLEFADAHSGDVRLSDHAGRSIIGLFRWPYARGSDGGDAAEFDKAAAPGVLHQATVIRVDSELDQIDRRAAPLPRQVAILVRAGEPIKADDIGDQIAAIFRVPRHGGSLEEGSQVEGQLTVDLTCSPRRKRMTAPNRGAAHLATS